MVFLLGLRLLGITALALAAAVTPVPIPAIAVVVVPILPAVTVAIALVTLTLLLLLHFFLDLRLSLRACFVEVLGTLPAGLSVGEHVLDEQLYTVADQFFILTVHEEAEAIVEFIEILLLVLFLGLADIFVQDRADLVHESDGTLDNQVVHVIIEIAETEQRLEDEEQGGLRQQPAPVKLTDEFVVAEELGLEDDGLLELVSVYVAFFFRHLRLVDGPLQD